MASARKAATGTKRSPAKRKTPRKAKSATVGLAATECAPGEDEQFTLAPLAARVEEVGGTVVGRYRDPLGGTPLLFAVLPIDQIEPTPFQRDLSDAHHKRLAEVIAKTARFLDPVIAVTAPPPARGFWTPNGLHRLSAMRRLGAKAITALVVADREVAWQILALNTEKAHNLKERALEVVRIYRGLVAEDDARPESSFAFYLEDPALVTLGMVYETNPRFAGGAYHPVLRRVERFSDSSLADTTREHELRAEKVVAVEAEVARAIEGLRARGLTSPYLRSFVVARCNPLRWLKADAELPSPDDVLASMLTRAKKFDVNKVRQEELAHAGGVPDDEG
jgi:ParB family chromosome partitioning protein